MEASEVVEPDAPAEGESADGTPVIQADGPEKSADAHEPLGAHDAHGSVTPSSAPPPESLAGSVAPDPVAEPPGSMTGA